MFSSKKSILLFVVFFIFQFGLTQTLSLQECEELSKKGVSEAQWQLGRRYELGNGITPDVFKAIALYKKAANQNHPKACERLAQFYESGTYVKKDLVLAAKYFAIAKNLDVNEEILKAQKLTQKNEDQIEKSLDYIIGRNGKTKDIKTGIRMLFFSAKENITARELLVKYCCKNENFDTVFEYFDETEREILIIYLYESWEKGYKNSGIILGINEYNKKDYQRAIYFWENSNTPEGWYLIGSFYNPQIESNYTEKKYKNENLAIKAYKKSLALNRNYEKAQLALGFLYLLADNSKNIDYENALDIFKFLSNKYPENNELMFLYGYTGYFLIEERISKSNYSYQLELEQLLITQKRYVNIIKKAAQNGEKAAIEFLKCLK